MYRSGLADSRIRFASNLKGGPALAPSEFSFWEERVSSALASRRSCQLANMILPV